MHSERLALGRSCQSLSGSVVHRLQKPRTGLFVCINVALYRYYCSLDCLENPPQCRVVVDALCKSVCKASQFEVMITKLNRSDAKHPLAWQCFALKAPRHSCFVAQRIPSGEVILIVVLTSLYLNGTHFSPAALNSKIRCSVHCIEETKGSR